MQLVQLESVDHHIDNSLLFKYVKMFPSREFYKSSCAGSIVYTLLGLTHSLVSNFSFAFTGLIIFAAVGSCTCAGNVL